MKGMKNTLTALFVTLASLSLGHTAQAPAAAPLAKDAAFEARIHRVENGLLPAVLVKGAPPATMSLAERMQFYKVPGVSVAVINEGRVEWARGFGVKEAGKSDPVTPETLFQAGSISKPVAALAALRLVQDGRLSLDEDVNAKLVSWKVPENEFTREQKVTLRRLLSHTAGLTVHGFPGYAADVPVPTVVQVLDGTSPASPANPANTAAVRVDTVPGTLWRYSGGGYTVMQQLLVDVTQKLFPDLLQQTVFEPLGLRHSTYEQPLPTSFAVLAATAHNNGQPIPGRWHIYPEMAAAGLWTTPADLAQIAIEIQRTLAGHSNKILTPATARQMVTVQMEDYGLGPGVEGTGASARFSHGGVDEGFEAFWIAYESTGQGAVVMTNGAGGTALVMEVIRAVAREYKWPDFAPQERALATVDPKTLAAYAGTYELRVSPERTITLAVTSEQGKIYTLQEGGSKNEWLPSSETEFFRTASGTTLQFVKDEQGRIGELVIHQGGQDYRGQRVK